MKQSQKRILSVLAAAAMTVCAVPQSAPLALMQPVLTASAADSVLDDLTWDQIDDGTGIIITGYNGEDTTLAIPDTIDGLPVTAIKSWAFSGKNTLVSVSLPDSITKIENNAFSQCKNLKSIIMPKSLTDIGNTAFGSCEALEKIELPDGVTSIGTGAFSSCYKLETVEIPETVTSIGETAFRDTAWLAAKREEDPLVIINHILIDGATCSGDVVFPDDVTVTSICGQAFYDNRKRVVNNVTVSGNNTMTSITLPDTVTFIGSEAFKECTALTSITIPESVTEIGTNVFADCTGLSEAVFPDTLTILSSGLFVNCSSLTSVKLPSALTKISGGMFQSCSGLKEIALPETVEIIESTAFLNCTGLESILLPKSLANIGMYAFRACTALKKVVIMNPSTHFHSANPFAMCSSDLTICGYAASTAETYAQQNDYTFEAIEAEFSDVSLTLTDDLALNFFAAGVNAENKDDYKVIFSGKCEENGKDTAFTEKNGLYCASANVSADNMGETITASLYQKTDDAWKKIDTCTYSVNQYLENAKPETGWSAEKTEAFDNLVKTVQLYGKVTYAYFNTPDAMPEVTDHRNDFMQNKKIYNRYLKYDAQTEEICNDTKYTDQFTLVLNSRTAMRWYLDGLTEGETGTLRLGTNPTLTAVNGKYGCYFEVPDFTPLELNNGVSVLYNGYEYQCSPLTWAYRIVADDDSSARNVAMANILFEYYTDATAFDDAD